MKKLLSVGLLILFMAVAGRPSSPAVFKLPDPITVEKNRITIGVWPQVELIAIVQAISQYPTVLDFLMCGDSSGYKTAMLSHFNPYRNHPVVRMFDRLSQQPAMLNFSAPSNLMLYCDGGLQLRRDFTPDEFVLKRIGGRDSLNVFLNRLRDFAVQTGFNKFYREHRSYYQTIVNITAGNLGQINYIAEIEGFFDQSQKSYNIVLVSLYGHVGFGNSILLPDGRREIYNTMGPRQVIDGQPFFGDEDYLKYLIRHEFSHPFVNPLTEKYWNNIKDYAQNYTAIPENARRFVCGDWQECINEFVIRAITTQFGYAESEAVGNKYYAKESSDGVSYLDTLTAKIREYQSQRDRYPTFDAYYPVILEVFKN